MFNYTDQKVVEAAIKATFGDFEHEVALLCVAREHYPELSPRNLLNDFLDARNTPSHI